MRTANWLTMCDMGPGRTRRQKAKNKGGRGTVTIRFLGTATGCCVSLVHCVFSLRRMSFQVQARLLHDMVRHGCCHQLTDHLVDTSTVTIYVLDSTQLVSMGNLKMGVGRDCCTGPNQLMFLQVNKVVYFFASWISTQVSRGDSSFRKISKKK